MKMPNLSELCALLVALAGLISACAQLGGVILEASKVMG